MSGATTAVRDRLTGGGSGRLPVAASAVVLLVLWQAVASTVPAYVFPTPVELLSAVVAVAAPGGEFSPTTNYAYTLLRVGVASAVCLVVGVTGGIAMGRSERTKEYGYVFVLMSFAFPSVIWAFLAVLWFGLTTLLVPVFVVCMIVVPYVVIVVEEGTRDLDHDLLEMGEAFGADADQLWREVYVPHLYPHIFASARLTFTLAWKITLVAELFGTRNGVGQVVRYFFQAQQNDMILAWAVPMMVLMYGVEQLLGWAETAAFAWRDEADRVVAG